jgi:dipeptidyl aminopeptidase/acylaminoacyl peptidase
VVNRAAALKVKSSPQRLDLLNKAVECGTSYDEAVSSTLDQLLTMRQPSDVQLSSGGERIAFVVADVAAGEVGEGKGRIWAGPVDGEMRQITRGPGTDQLPRFSADGSKLAFASDRDHPGRASLFVLAPGAEAMQVGEIPGSVEDIRWCGDRDELVVLAADVGSDTAGIAGATEIVADGDSDPEVRRPGKAWRRLYRVDLATAESTEVGPGDGLTIWEFSLYGEGDNAVALVSEDPSEGGWYEASIARIDLARRQVTNLYVSDLQLACPRVSPDGTWLAWTENVCSDRGVVAGTVNLLGLESGTHRELAANADVASLQWIDDARLCVIGPRASRVFVSILDVVDDELEELFSGPVRLGTAHQPAAAFDSETGVFATVHEGLGAPPEVAVFNAARQDLGWREVSDLNRHLRGLAVPEVDEISWQGDDGLEIEGLLARPAGAEAALPMIVNIHGGPTACWEWGFSPGCWNTTQLFTEAGYAVLLPNPRGSAGRGREFAAANVGDVGGGDFRDIVAGVDACVERGIAIDEQVGAWGASYGGFMSCWLAGNTDRFAALVPVACHSNWLSFHNTANIPAFDRQFVGADPYDTNGKYLELSPVVHAPKATTPTLFLHGAIDKICPLSQAEEMYRALVEAGVETELVIYPREGHHLIEERAHAVDAIGRLLSWMNRHVCGIEPDIGS